LPASINCPNPNPLLELDGSPFYIVGETTPWRRIADRDGAPVPLRAGVTGLGFGGTNCHVLLEEYIGTAAAGQVTSRDPEVVLLSARTSDALAGYARKMVRYIEMRRANGEAELVLADIAHTLRVGRDVMPVRVSVTADSIDALVERLRAVGAGSEADGVRYGVTETASAQSPITGRRISLPGYPFARERYWADRDAPADRDDSSENWSRLLRELRDGAKTVDAVERLLEEPTV
jgi:acyl transferase domain-containing protein